MIDNRYMPDTFLQACDFVRILKAAYPKVAYGAEPRSGLDVVNTAIDMACKETGWRKADIRQAIFFD